MRVLCTVTGSAGHANAVLPITRALTAAGHEVCFAVTEDLAPRFAGEEGDVHAVLPGTMEKLAPIFHALRAGEGRSPELLTQFADPAAQTVWMTTGKHVSAGARALLPIAKAFGPDLVLRDGPELAGCLVAEALDIPHVSAPSGDGNVLDPRRAAAPLNGRPAR